MFERPNDNPVPRPKTCWSNRTPFQMGLILMLAVAVSFFIGLIIVYIVYGTVLNNSEKCDTMCSVLQHGEPPETERKKRSLENPCYSRVAALVEPLYTDDDEDLVFKCSVVVMSPNWVLTIEECLNGTTEPLVRLNSKYWSQGGVLKKVEMFIAQGQHVALRLERSSSHNEECVTPVKNLSMYFWNAKKKKFGELKAVNVQIQNYRQFFFEDSKDCGTETGAPIFDQYQKLTGFQISSSCDDSGQKILTYRRTDHSFDYLLK